MQLERRAEASRALLVAAPFAAVAFTLVVSSLLVAWAGAPRPLASMPRTSKRSTNLRACASAAPRRTTPARANAGLR